MRYAKPSLRNVPVAVAAAALVWSAAALSAAGDPQKQVKAADQAYAKTLVLRKADLPAGRWAVEPTSFSGTNPDCVVRRYSLSALTATGETGLTYTRGVTLIESNARLFLTATQAARAFSILSSVGLGRCLGTAEAAGVGARVGAKVTVKPLAFAGLGVPVHGFGILLNLRSSQQTLTLNYVVLTARRGRALATLGLVKSGDAWPAAVVRSLAAKTAGRMTKR